jgi:hypothetical protein
MNKQQQYFIPVLYCAAGVYASRPDGEKVHVHLLIQGPYDDDGEKVIETAFGNDGRVVVQSKAGAVIAGRVIDLPDIIGWAIQSGYLEAVGDKLVTE